jgi:ribonucleotide monophosphatase NagD (HAD superfamily)
VEACTGARAEAVMGKPSEHMAAELLRRLAVPAGEAAVVGDRISTDVALARSLGMTSVLVLSGATTAAEAARSPRLPDYVVGGIAALLPDARPAGLTERSPR